GANRTVNGPSVNGCWCGDFTTPPANPTRGLQPVVGDHIPLHVVDGGCERRQLLGEGGGELPQLPRELLALGPVEPAGGGAGADEEPGQAVAIEELVDEAGDTRVLADQVEVTEPALEGGLVARPRELERALLRDAAEGGEDGRGGGV